MVSILMTVSQKITPRLLSSNAGAHQFYERLKQTISFKFHLIQHFVMMTNLLHINHTGNAFGTRPDDNGQLPGIIAVVHATVLHTNLQGAYHKAERLLSILFAVLGNFAFLEHFNVIKGLIMHECTIITRIIFNKIQIAITQFSNNLEAGEVACKNLCKPFV